MKVCEQKNEVTLRVHGREMTFSEEQLRVILEKHFPSETKQVALSKVVKRPTLGEWFEVDPLSINQKLFEKERRL